MNESSLVHFIWHRNFPQFSQALVGGMNDKQGMFLAVVGIHTFHLTASLQN